VTSGKPNALETTIEEDRGCSGTEDMTCGGPRYTGNTCCKGGYHCVQKTSTSRWMTCQPKCVCRDFMKGGYGNCKKDYEEKGTSKKGKICYVPSFSRCADQEWSNYANSLYSWIACNPSS